MTTSSITLEQLIEAVAHFRQITERIDCEQNSLTDHCIEIRRDGKPSIGINLSSTLGFVHELLVAEHLALAQIAEIRRRFGDEMIRSLRL